jgi:GT2 family glycosyltransferase/glycosyltransferase involved in cell wall biosynthesis
MNNNRSGTDRPTTDIEPATDKPAVSEEGNTSAFEILLEAANQRAEAALDRERAMRASMSWRVTAPLRKAASTVSPQVRANLRRVAKAAWWAMTPWRMPARLRAMRFRPLKEVVLRGTTDASDAYGVWIATNEMRSPLLPDRVAGQHVSFLLTAGASPEKLQQTLKSLLSQSVGHWDALVAVSNDAPDDIQTLLEGLSKDKRITRIPVSSDSRAPGLAACLASASGDLVALLDAGDMLAAGALNELAHSLRRAPRSDILYGDEDQLSQEGLRQNPYFKPGWSPDLLYAFNYFGRLTLLRRELVAQVGGVDATMGAGVEWDLNLRACEKAGIVTRIPKVLCHRGGNGESERPAPASEAAADQRKALRNRWARAGIAANIETQPDGTQRSVWQLQAPPLVSIVIPTKDKADLLQVCLDGLLQGTDYPNKEIILVDTGSTEESTLAYYERLRAFPEVSIVHFGRKFNYSAACNFGAGFARGDLMLFLNNDVEIVTADWLQELVRFAQRPGVGVVGTQLRYPGGELQHGGVGVGVTLCGLMYHSDRNDGWGIFGSADHPRNWMAVMGACQMVVREAFERAGGFDEAYAVAFSDVALCLRVWRLGYRTAYAPHARLLHHEGATRGVVNPTADLQRFADDVRLLGIDEDPYLHPELDANQPIPSLRIGEARSPRESLQIDTRALGSMMLPSLTLDLQVERSSLEAAGLPREDVLWLPQPAYGVTDVWSAARWCLDLLRTCPEVVRRFPTALSEGPQGRFGAWIAGEGGVALGLSGSARSWIVQCLGERLGARARQAYLFDEDVKTRLPHGLLPMGQHALFRWFMREGRHVAGLRLEEIWWLFHEAVERPAAELVRAYAFSPAWQALYPDGLTVFGRRAFAGWLAATYRVRDPWIDPACWPLDITPARQIRAAYWAREDWRLLHPCALDDQRHATALVEWLATPASAQPPDVVEWCAALDVQQVSAELVAPGLNVIGHFAYPSGLRVSIEALVEGAQGAGVQTSLRDLKTDRKDDPLHADFQGFEDFETTLIHVQPEPFFDKVYSRSDLFERLPRTYRIGYWYWEFDVIPDSWLSHIDEVDEIWVATEFVARGLRAKVSKPVHTIFPGVKLGSFDRRTRAHFGLETAPYTFLFTFHMMSVMERKNPLGLIRAFASAFKPEESVQLVLKTSFAERHPEQFKALKDAAASAGNVKIINEVYSPGDVLALMDVCDAYVSLHRSEGLGLTMAEAMLMGKPVIATDFSGNVDFMNESNSLPVRHEIVKLGKAIPPYEANFEWAQPSESHAAELMRRVYDDQAWAAELGEKGRASAEAALSLEVAGAKVAQRLNEIQALRRSKRSNCA